MQNLITIEAPELSQQMRDFINNKGLELQSMQRSVNGQIILDISGERDDLISLLAEFWYLDYVSYGQMESEISKFFK